MPHFSYNKKPSFGKPAIVGLTGSNMHYRAVRADNKTLDYDDSKSASIYASAKKKRVAFK